ncbi:uncharacterized protein BP01DRAFT_420483 [Aspergillus saccharolyticus JOP 1030-1]|uniref:Rhodopsin domain-containing protein n=1 Tax=Aspergillus saccharolyticus JOP 1030-1 TaxID=1450539 RepID=A0A319AAQ1_9EURO|nr:hypothetical protein BP01DRAFT_420483 [Aspergillus saccharolyticus JOP 1030-1]PYH48708.1 hypothetical protein BP01DRAFT_420483 [Aspergillus saccharolyticus JOP 1030-1]
MPGGMHPPLSVIASWPPRNTVNPESHGPAALVLAAVVGGMAFVTVMVRLYARCFIQHQGGIDDILIALALLPTLGLIIAVPIGTEVYGEKYHTWDNTVSALIGERKVAVAAELCYVLASGLIKSSVLLFYRRMSQRTVSPRFRALIWVSIASVIAYSLAFVLALFLSCRPFRAFWHQVDPFWTVTHHYSCYDEGAHLITATAISLAQDLLATTLPAVFCIRLHMRRRQKLALTAVFSVGYLTAVIAGIRVFFLWRMYYESYDGSWMAWYCWVLALLEVALAATSASLPAVKVFFRWYNVPASLADKFRSFKYSHSYSTRSRQSGVTKGSRAYRDRRSNNTDQSLVTMAADPEMELESFTPGLEGESKGASEQWQCVSRETVVIADVKRRVDNEGYFCREEECLRFAHPIA